MAVEVGRSGGRRRTAVRRPQFRKHGHGVGETGRSGRSVSGQHLVVARDVGLLEERTERRLELPVGRLKQLLRLIGSAPSRQHKLVYHDLVLQFFHIHRHSRF